MADGLDMQIDQNAITALLKKLGDVADGPKMQQAMLDAAVVGELAVKKELEAQIYSKPERGYRRRKGAGLSGATKATGKVDKDSKEIKTGVISAKNYAKYVFFGTGIHAKGGKGRKTPWVFRDGFGRFHWTVGQVPKPYMTKGIDNAKIDIIKVLGKGLI